MLLCVTTVTAVSTSPGGASSFACDARGNYFAGYVKFPTNEHWEGASAVLISTTRSVSLCGNDQFTANFSNSWTKIAAGNGAGWAQSGFIRRYGQLSYHFAQTKANTGYMATTLYGSSVADGELHQYWQQWLPDCGCIHSNVDSTRFIDSWFDPFAWWQAPFSPQYMAETSHRSSDIPGGINSHVYWRLLYVQELNNSWSNTPCGFPSRNDNPAFWNVSTTTCPAFDTWAS